MQWLGYQMSPAIPPLPPSDFDRLVDAIVAAGPGAEIERLETERRRRFAGEQLETLDAYTEGRTRALRAGARPGAPPPSS